MFDEYHRYAELLKVEPPDTAEVFDYLRRLPKQTAYAHLLEARRHNRMLVQPRCGVGDHERMRALITDLEAKAAPDIATITIDAHTRLKRFEIAARAAKDHPHELNGYPLVAHGWKLGRELNESVSAPVQIRHGSPDPRLLFEVAVAAGFSAFEGGGIGYNIPYCKDVSLQDSLTWWREVDAKCGELAERGVIVDREFFGTLTAVLMPPSIQLAIAFLEAMMAHAAGVRCLSIAVCQTGHTVQDIAMLRVIPRLASKLLPDCVDYVFPVFHQFMGAFPHERQHCDALILRGAMVGKAGGAVKTINKTYQESLGIPSLEANVGGVLLSKAANSWILDLIDTCKDSVEEESAWLIEEVSALLSPVLDEGDLVRSICDAFSAGRLDVPFSASRHALAKVVPMRAPDGAIRIFDFGQLPIPLYLQRRHRKAIGHVDDDDIFYKLEADIMWFCRQRNQELVTNGSSVSDT